MIDDTYTLNPIFDDLLSQYTTPSFLVDFGTSTGDSSKSAIFLVEVKQNRIPAYALNAKESASFSIIEPVSFLDATQSTHSKE